MRIVTSLLAAVAVVGALSACDPSEIGSSTPTTVQTHTVVPVEAPRTVTPTTLRGSITDADRVFLSQLSDHWKNGIDRGELFRAGESACARMRAGQKMQVIQIMSDGEMQPDGSLKADATGLANAASFVHAAATAYCPDQLSGVN